MRLVAVSDLIGHPGAEAEASPVLELGLELTLQDQQDVALPAPCLLYTSDAADEL